MKTKKYTLTLARNVCAYGTVEFAAKNDAEAKDIARKILNEELDNAEDYPAYYSVDDWYGEQHRIVGLDLGSSTVLEDVYRDDH